MNHNPFHDSADKFSYSPWSTVQKMQICQWIILEYLPFIVMFVYEFEVLSRLESGTHGPWTGVPNRPIIRLSEPKYRWYANLHYLKIHFHLVKWSKFSLKVFWVSYPTEIKSISYWQQPNSISQNHSFSINRFCTTQTVFTSNNLFEIDRLGTIGMF